MSHVQKYPNYGVWVEGRRAGRPKPLVLAAAFPPEILQQVLDGIISLGCDEVIFCTDSYMYRGDPGTVPDEPLSLRFAKGDKDVTESLVVVKQSMDSAGDAEVIPYSASELGIEWGEMNSESLQCMTGKLLDKIDNALTWPSSPPEAGASAHDLEGILNRVPFHAEGPRAVVATDELIPGDEPFPSVASDEAPRPFRRLARAWLAGTGHQRS